MSYKTILEFATIHNCSNVYSACLLFIPGIKNVMSNLYVLLVFNYNDRSLSYLVLYHRPRGADVIKLLDNLEDKSSSLLIFIDKHPFTIGKVNTYVKNNFMVSKKFKTREELIGVYEAYNYLKHVLSKVILNTINNNILISSKKSAPHFIESTVVDFYIAAWNKKRVDLISPCMKDYQLTPNKPVSKDLYTFEVEIKEKSDFEIKLHLYPQERCNVDVKLLKSVYDVIITNKDITEFSYPKALLISVLSEDGNWFTLAKSQLLGSKTSLESFLYYYKESLFNLKNRAYPLDNLDFLALRVIKLKDGSNFKSSKLFVKPSQLASKGIRKFSSISSVYNVLNSRNISTISRLVPKVSFNAKLGVVDIETIVVNNIHVPYAIGYKLYNQKAVTYYITDYGKSIKPSSIKIINAFLDDFLVNAKGYTIYCHNLGSFDGYILLKELNRANKKLNILMDKQHKFISIDILESNIKFRDSLRILPTSLDSLSKIFDVEIKKGTLDHSRVNKILLFSNNFKLELLAYLEKDLISLMDVLINASKQLLQDYNIDFSKCLSASAMAMKIYRTKFIKLEIPILPSHIDTIIRDSYRGGATEVYKTSGNGLYYYDINSLYPYAMINKMPYKFICVENKVDLNNFFGFVVADVYAPLSVFNPFLPFKDVKTGNIQYPHGQFRGIFFSEELKLAQSKGYKITPTLGYRFSKEYLFRDYVTHFYDKKTIASGGARFLYKLMLNSIYGYLGRNTETLKTEILDRTEVVNVYSNYFIYNHISLENNKVLIVRDLQPSRELQSALSIENLKFNTENIKKYNNIAIASAITSYARIAMVPVKTDVNNPPLYTDTDSIFLSKPLPNHLIGDGLGQFKDELNGSTISEGLFLAPKMYGYKVNNTEKVVIAGVKPNSVTYKELQMISDNKTIIKEKSTIIKDLGTISIINKKSKINLTLSKDNMVKQPVYDKNKKLTHFKPVYLTKLNPLL
uniref:Probable DNA polymerase n=1 Tax=Parasitella parasitica TaxID=35722 RepID=A0A088S6F9_9FUNG|nr:DNA polymerase family B [Parasitella parasitica]AIO05756.1 DNA polymerase family B [Parasitella parasitica]